MRWVLQRVKHASVVIDEQTVAQIQKGYLILVGIAPDDTSQVMDWCIEKVLKLRLFEDSQGLMGRSLQDIQGEVLLVSQFTLFADVRKGTRPSFSQAAPPQQAKQLYEELVQRFRQRWMRVQSGVFAADMQVSLCNDGPVTLVIDREIPVPNSIIKQHKE